MGAAWRMIAVVVLFALALGAIIVQRVHLLNSGREIVLQVEPVDPRDFFRGDYVQLQYDVSTFLVPDDGPIPLRDGDTVYVALHVRPDGHAGFMSGHRILAEARAASPAVIRGRVDFVGPLPARDTDRGRVTFCGARSCTMVRAKFGIESYFVPQGEGRALEQARNARRLEMLIALSDDGEAAIKGLILDGKRAYVEGLF
jgi:hypothetical protein